MPFYRLDDGKTWAHVNLGRRRGPAACVGPRLERDDPKIGLKCFRMSVALCDYPVGTDVDGKTLTCDAPVCDHHRTQLGGNVDHCWKHGQGQLPGVERPAAGIDLVADELRRRMRDQRMKEQTTTCDQLKGRVMTTADWLAKHRDHGDLTEEPFPHPSGTWRNLVCSCGAKHLTDGQT